MQRVAFLCLGTMGGPMAAHLARAGYDLAVYNRTRARAEAWVGAHGGCVADSPAAAARGRDIVLACTGNDDDLAAIALGEGGALDGMPPGSVFVDHTTVSADVTRELARAARERGLAWVDAPVSGGESGAQQGVLTVMCGGDREAFERVRPVVETYARAVTRMGPSGAGQLTKMVNQICLAGLIQGLAEGLRFAQRAGLDAQQVVDVIAQGAAQSWQMDHRARTMLEGRFDFGFAVDWMCKDLGIALAEARRNGAQLPVTAQVERFYAELQARGDGRLDTSSLIRRLA
ncbi:MAG: NAD(P)-dependent oxidoreductase [Deltaproteobacteria bacterium]|nr:MAG: NAD(P)-dependent oxidoreductase [Deltaproteobacteria bacterium]